MCGSPVDHHRLTTIIEEQKQQLLTMTKLLTDKERQLQRMKGDGDKKLRSHRHYPVAMRVLQDWQRNCYPKARELEGGERLKNVVDRLQGGHTEEELFASIAGYSRFPYVVNGRRMAVGTPAQRRVDAELIFRDPKHVADGIALAAEADRRDQVLTRSAPTESPSPLPTIVDPPSTNGHGPKLAELGQAARRFAERFIWQVFPVEPKGKRPVTEHGLLDATTDVEKIEAFWAIHPQHNVAIRCGVQSGLVVLDVDGQDGIASLRALEQKYDLLPQTLSVVTPRGGQHYYFAHPGSGEIHNTTGFPGPGLDIRGDGGYVVAPPSAGPNGRCYEVDEEAKLANFPMWLLTLLINRQSELPLFGRDYETLVSAGVRSGARNNQLTSLVGHLIAHGHSPDFTRDFTLGINQARCSPPLPNRDVVKIVESVVKRERRKSQKVLKEIIGQAYV
jgi:hypothetical protein